MQHVASASQSLDIAYETRGPRSFGASHTTCYSTTRERRRARPALHYHLGGRRPPSARHAFGHHTTPLGVPVPSRHLKGMDSLLSASRCRAAYRRRPLRSARQERPVPGCSRQPSSPSTTFPVGRVSRIAKRDGGGDDSAATAMIAPGAWLGCWAARSLVDVRNGRAKTCLRGVRRCRRAGRNGAHLCHGDVRNGKRTSRRSGTTGARRGAQSLDALRRRCPGPEPNSSRDAA